MTRVGIALLVIGLLRGAYSMVMAWRDDRFSTATLRAASEEINRQLPAYIGTEMQLVHTSASEGRMVYEFRLVNYKGAGEAIRSPATRQQMQQAACRDDKAREFFRHRVHLLYQIASSDDRPIAAIEIAPSDCGL